MWARSLAALFLVLSPLACEGAMRASAPKLTRRAALAGSLSLLPLGSRAAEPVPAPVLTDAEMAARVARKQELLRKADLKSKSDVKVLFGGDFQRGVRTSSPIDSSTTKPMANRANWYMWFWLRREMGSDGVWMYGLMSLKGCVDQE